MVWSWVSLSAAMVGLVSQAASMSARSTLAWSVSSTMVRAFYVGASLRAGCYLARCYQHAVGCVVLDS